MYEKYPELIFKSETVDRIGKIENVVGMSIEASGGRSGVGDLVMIYAMNPGAARSLRRLWVLKRGICS